MKVSKNLYKDFTGSWKQAIKEGVELLVQSNFATQQLEKAILKTTKDLGPYYVLVPGVALQHAPLGSYCKKPGVSVMFSQKPVSYDRKKPDKWAKIIFTLSVVDQTSHMGFISKFGKLFGSQENIVFFLQSKNINDFLERVSLKGGGIW